MFGWKWILGLGAGAFALAGEIAREQKTFRITHYQIRSPKLNGLTHPRTVVFLSDLHNKEYGKENSILLNAIRETKPDLILAGGDMLIGKRGISPAPAVRFLRQLPQIAPVYCANGNHEQRMRERPWDYDYLYDRYKNELLQAGVHFLENESVQLFWDSCNIQVTGLEIPEEYYEQFARGRLSVKEIRDKVGNAGKDGFQILMAHNPVFFDTYRAWGADLTLSGHLHGGIARIPGIGGVITPQFQLFPKYSGELTKKEQAYIAVSKGLGTHTVNIRFLNRAELVVLDLQTD